MAFNYVVTEGGSASNREFLLKLRGWLVESLRERPPRRPNRSSTVAEVAAAVPRSTRRASAEASPLRRCGWIVGIRTSSHIADEDDLERRGQRRSRRPTERGVWVAKLPPSRLGRSWLQDYLRSARVRPQPRLRDHETGGGDVDGCPRSGNRAQRGSWPARSRLGQREVWRENGHPATGFDATASLRGGRHGRAKAPRPPSSMIDFEGARVAKRGRHAGDSGHEHARARCGRHHRPGAARVVRTLPAAQRRPRQDLLPRDVAAPAGEAPLRARVVRLRALRRRDRRRPRQHPDRRSRRRSWLEDWSTRFLKGERDTDGDQEVLPAIHDTIARWDLPLEHFEAFLDRMADGPRGHAVRRRTRT